MEFVEGHVKNIRELFTYKDESFSKYEQRVTDYGYVEEYTNNDVFCQR